MILVLALNDAENISLSKNIVVLCVSFIHILPTLHSFDSFCIILHEYLLYLDNILFGYVEAASLVDQDLKQVYEYYWYIDISGGWITSDDRQREKYEREIREAGLKRGTVVHW